MCEDNSAPVRVCRSRRCRHRCSPHDDRGRVVMVGWLLLDATLPAGWADKRTLTRLHRRYILICMRTTLNLDQTLLEKAAHLTGIKEKTALIHLGLETLIAHE